MRAKELWLFLFFMGVLAFNWPFTAVFASYLPVYIFFAWGAFILLIRLVAGRDGTGGRGR